MSGTLRYLSHPQVNIDPKIPVPEWGLSELGRRRIDALNGALTDTKTILSSAETKAIESATIISGFLDIPVTIAKDTGEIDRSHAGYMQEEEFDATRQAFFAKPDISIKGWETALAAQTRIVRAYKRIVKSHNSGDILIAGHGGVGTLLYCHLANLPISVDQDQSNGGGNFFATDLNDNRPLHPWQPIETLHP